MTEINCANVKFNDKPKRKNGGTGLSTSSVFNIKPKVQICTNELADLTKDLKKKDIRAAFPFMPLQDREYYRVVLHQ